MQPLPDTFLVPSNILIWVLHNQFSLQIYISTGPTDQTPALVKQYSPLSRHKPSIPFYWGGGPRDYMGQPLRQVPSPLFLHHPIVSTKQLDESLPSQPTNLLGVYTWRKLTGQFYPHTLLNSTFCPTKGCQSFIFLTFDI
jgi:hypothetical protein